MRITNLTIKNNMLTKIQNNYSNSEKLEQQLGSGKKMTFPSQAPIDSINSIYSRIRNNQINQYQKNTDHLRGAVDLAYSTLDSANALIQRVRELTVKNANGTYSEEGRRNSATEVEQILRQLVSMTETQYKDSYLFSGSDGLSKPFDVTYTKTEDGQQEIIQSVTPMTNKNPRKVEIDKGNVVDLDFSANTLFWSQNNIVISKQDSSNYVSNRNQTININGKDVSILQGDNLDAVVDKINATISGVHAEKQELPDGTISFGIKSTTPSKIEMLDLEGSTVLQDLGMILPGIQGRNPANNIHPNTIQVGGSAFDILINLRDSLLNNEAGQLGTLHLGAVTDLENSLIQSQTQISAMAFRLNSNEEKLSQEKVDNTTLLSKAEDVDIVQASINFNEVMNLHRVSLMTGAKINQTTLMDYLR